MRVFYLLSFLVALTFPAFGDEDDIKLQYHIDREYYGERVVKDYAKAFDYHSKHARDGFFVNKNELGILYANGQGVAQDEMQALYLFEQAAEQGNMYAQYNLAWLYQFRPNVGRDYLQAQIWLEKAAEQGHIGALTHLGDLYINGGSIPQDYARAIEFYTRAAERGDARAQVAERPQSRAQYMLGLFYATGEEGVEQDLQKAQYWLEKSLALVPDEYKDDREIKEVQEMIEEIKMMQNQQLQKQD